VVDGLAARCQPRSRFAVPPTACCHGVPALLPHQVHRMAGLACSRVHRSASSTLTRGFGWDYPATSDKSADQQDAKPLHQQLPRGHSDAWRPAEFDVDPFSSSRAELHTGPAKRHPGSEERSVRICRW
jgi:hypothetical protein